MSSSVMPGSTSESHMPEKVEAKLRALSITDKPVRKFRRLSPEEKEKELLRREEIMRGVIAQSKIGWPCETCLNIGHSSHKCPLLKSARENEKVGHRWVIVCRCCWKKDSHPGDDKVKRCAALRFCAKCRTSSHMLQDCPMPEDYRRPLLKCFSIN